MRNITRVVLWGLPPSFCGLIQRAGRTGRDFETLGEAILIVPAGVIKNGTKEAEVEQAVQDAVTESQAENRGDEEQTLLEENGIELAGGNQEVLVNDGGVRVEHDDSEPEEETSGKTQRRRKLSKNDTNSLEAQYLTMFACAARCLRVIWDEFFKNSTKCKWV
jgi:superfamily II DNA/RNA helicase